MQKMTEEEPDSVFAFRKQILDDFREKLPLLGQFSAEEYIGETEGMGSVYVPDFKQYSKFTNLKSRHIKPLFKALWMIEVASATREGRRIDMEKIIANFEVSMGDINGWRSTMYNRTGMEALRASAVPPQKLSWRERRAMRKQGGW